MNIIDLSNMKTIIIKKYIIIEIKETVNVMLVDPKIKELRARVTKVPFKPLSE